MEIQQCYMRSQLENLEQK